MVHKYIICKDSVPTLQIKPYFSIAKVEQRELRRESNRY